MQAPLWLADANCDSSKSHVLRSRQQCQAHMHDGERERDLLCVYVHLNIFIGQCKKSRSLIKTTRISGSHEINWNASRRAPQNQSPSLRLRRFYAAMGLFLSLSGSNFSVVGIYSGLIIFGSCWLLGELIKRSAINFYLAVGMRAILIALLRGESSATFLRPF